MHAIYIEETFYSSFTNSSSSSVVYTREFLYFTQVWVIKASSPTVCWSNGQAERFVQTLKRMLIKAQADRRDPYLAPSDYRNSPISDLLTLQHRCSWADAFAARSQQPLCSCAIGCGAHPSSLSRQQRQKQFYDCGTKPLLPLKERGWSMAQRT